MAEKERTHNCKCRICGRTYAYDREVGYDRELCGLLCDGVEHGRLQAKQEIDKLKRLLESVEAKEFAPAEFYSIDGKNWWDVREELTGLPYWKYRKGDEIKSHISS